ncbi:hypothetical protein M8A51_05430 [Schlegelella sp. S2-27]|uniref:Uncharacterized protein n=1 Tax=Caldimonas mangrovi TaxID=2944811 RepID=A0ABT0YJR3_9BURK|nr:hypothetical protein [Caldimonas mangrovi]MCM5678970.1 hypothetical protein [Caldimonas mangrovi]
MQTQRTLSSSVVSSSPRSAQARGSALAFVRRQARELLREARDERLMVAMPAVRRVHAAGLFGTQPLSTLYRERQRLQLKHFLRALALEAGHPSWERYKPVLETLPAQALGDYQVEALSVASLHPWFSNAEQAQAYADVHGGRVVRYRGQAVVISDDTPPPR